MKKLLIGLILIFCLVSIVNADFRLTTDMDGQNNKIYNLSNLNSTYIYKNGSEVLTIGEFNTTNYYTKSQVYNKNQTYNTSEVYTKTEIENKDYINETEINSTQFTFTTFLGINLTWLESWVNDLSKWLNYYTKSEVYNTTEIDAQQLAQNNTIININSTLENKTDDINSTLSSEIDSVNSSLQTEISDRQTADDGLNTTIQSVNTSTNNRITSVNDTLTNNYYNKTDSDDRFLKLDQSSYQTIINGIPQLEETRNYTNQHQLADKLYVDTAVTALGLRFYMLNTSSGVEDYKNTQQTDSIAAFSNTYESLTDGQYITGWISPSDANITTLLAGVYDWVTFLGKTSGTKDLRVYWTLNERLSNSSEILIATSANSNLITDKGRFDVILNLNSDYELSAGSRVVGKLYAIVGTSGVAPDLTLYGGGAEDSHWEIPTNKELLDTLFVSQTEVSSLSVNQSDYWDSYDTPADISISEFPNDAGYFNDLSNFTGTLTDTKICTYDSANTEIDCDYTDLNTEYTASGTLLDLTGTVFSINEGTLTNDKFCKFITGSGIVCDYTTATNVTDTRWDLDNSTYLYNKSDSADVNVSLLDDTHTHDCSNITGATSDLCTITDTDTTYDNGTGIALTGTTFSLAWQNLSYFNIDLALSDFSNDVGYFNSLDNFTGTLTDTKICTYDSAGTEIDCDYTDQDTTYTAGGTLLDLTTDTFSVNEGTLTDDNFCNYEATGTQLECTNTANDILSNSANIDASGNIEWEDANDLDADGDVIGANFPSDTKACFDGDTCEKYIVYNSTEGAIVIQS